MKNNNKKKNRVYIYYFVIRNKKSGLLVAIFYFSECNQPCKDIYKFIIHYYGSSNKCHLN